MAKRIREAGTLAPAKAGPGKRLLTLITPGVGSSGTYSAEMLQRAAEEKVFPRGTQGHIDHDSEREMLDKPAGSLRNLALYLTEDAYWDGEALVAEAKIGTAWNQFVDDFHEILGVSINALAEVADDDEISRLIPDPFNRADLVTVAGRGGRVGEAREAARVIESRSLRATETTNGDLNGWLANAVRTAHNAGGDRYVWFEDYDDQFVYFTTDSYDTTRTYRQAYTLDGSTVALTGDPEPVHRRTEYDPVTPTDSPAVPAGAVEKKENATMAHIEDAELQTLRENASRATELEQELATVKKAAETAAREARQDKALAAVHEAFGKDAPKFYVTAAESAAKDEDYDHDAFTAMVTEAAAARESEQGAGTPSGVGQTTATESAPKSFTEEDYIAALEGR